MEGKGDEAAEEEEDKIDTRSQPTPILTMEEGVSRAHSFQGG